MCSTRDECGKPTPTTPLEQASWTQVLGRKQRKRERKSAKTLQPQDRQPSQSRQPRQPRRRPPKTAAVAIQRKGDKYNYVDILKEAKSKVNLQQLGIEDTRIRRAITGGIIIEIPGDQGSQKADTLTNSLRTVFTAAEDVTISRPTKRAELRISGIDDSTTPADVQAIVAELGHCSL